MRAFSDNLRISVVSPFFNEEGGVLTYKSRVEACLEKLNSSFQIVSVDDGSVDGTWNLLSKAAESDTRWTAIRLSRNFGHQAAISAGLDHANGDIVFILDGDLQDPPELFAPMLERWLAGADVVYGVRRTRSGVSWIKKLAYHCFYRLLSFLSDYPIPLDAGDFRLLDRKVVLALRSMPEQQRFLRGMVSWAGFRQEAFPYDRDARAIGNPKYTFRKLLQLAMDGMISFSLKPLRLAIYLATISVLGALFLIIWLIYGAFFINTAPKGWTSVMIVILLASSSQLLVLGIIGEYLGRVFMQSKDRPVYIVSKLINYEKKANAK